MSSYMTLPLRLFWKAFQNNLNWRGLPFLMPAGYCIRFLEALFVDFRISAQSIFRHDNKRLNVAGDQIYEDVGGLRVFLHRLSTQTNCKYDPTDRYIY